MCTEKNGIDLKGLPASKAATLGHKTATIGDGKRKRCRSLGCTVNECRRLKGRVNTDEGPQLGPVDPERVLTLGLKFVKGLEAGEHTDVMLGRGAAKEDC
jgi:hypothetical protein